jgi:hypothetical protein
MAIDGTSGELMNKLLNDFINIFTEPQGLTSEQHMCHSIRLEHMEFAVIVHPYQYTHIVTPGNSLVISELVCA